MKPIIKQAVVGLASLSTLGAALFLMGAFRNGNFDHWSIFWNLFLAWVPFVAALTLVGSLQRHRWQSWLPLSLTTLWLVFLPNTFYMITDYIHLHDVPRVDGAFDTLMFSVIVANGVLLGYVSMLLVHYELRRRMSPGRAWRYILGVFLLSGFAIYFGRYLRWNSWDIISNPAGILFDISELVLNPFSNLRAFSTTLIFAATLTIGYYVIRRTIAILRK